MPFIRHRHVMCCAVIHRHSFPSEIQDIKRGLRKSRRRIMQVNGAFYSLLILVVFEVLVTVNGRLLSESKPNPKDAAATARWLVSQNTWGVLSTISRELGGAPFGNVVSFSDGVPDEGHGIPYFYLTELDPTARNALIDQRSSFTLSEYPIGSCGKIDPENPTCSKITLNGKGFHKGSLQLEILRNLTLAAILWTLWKEKNSRIFKDTTSFIRALVHSSLSRLLVWASSCDYCSSLDSQEFLSCENFLQM